MRLIFRLAILLLLTQSAAAQDLPIRPDPRMTPGAALTMDLAAICRPGYTKTVRHTSGDLKAAIYREYGIDRRSGHFEIDHLIPLCLGGADVAANLWPQSYDTMPWNASKKDELEVRVCRLACAGSLPIERLQREIAADWIAAYGRYVGRP